MNGLLQEPFVPFWLSSLLLALVIPTMALLVVLSALIERSGPIRLRHWAEKAGGALRNLYEVPQRFEAFRFVLSLLAKFAPVAVLGALWDVLRAKQIAAAPWIAIGGVMVLIFLLEWTNRALVLRHSEASLRRLSWVAKVLYQMLVPVVWPLAKWVPRDSDLGEDDDDVSDDEIEAYIDVGLREGIIDSEDEDLVRSIVDFGETQVRSVMTPRVEIVSGSVEGSAEEIAAIFFSSKHARLPLYRGSIDQIVGILHIRDLFEAMYLDNDGASPVDLEALAKTPLYVPENKSLSELLKEMQGKRQQMAIVVDEYGGVAGLVTVEDLVEEIVGDIADEHEEPEIPHEELPDGGWRFLGRTDLEELEEIFDLDLDEVPYETVSGLICGQLGYVPESGEQIEAYGLSFRVEDADERRVTTVTVRVTEASGAAQAPEGQEGGR